jgi:hypothetical protein
VLISFAMGRAEGRALPPSPCSVFQIFAVQCRASKFDEVCFLPLNRKPGADRVPAPGCVMFLFPIN